MKKESAPSVALVRKALENLRKWTKSKGSIAVYPLPVVLGMNMAAERALSVLERMPASTKFHGKVAERIEMEADDAAGASEEGRRRTSKDPYRKAVYETLAKLAYFPREFLLEYGKYSEIPLASSSAYQAGRGQSFGAASSTKVTPERAARRRIIPAADPYERERLEKEADELAELERAAEARAEARLDRYWSRRY